MEDPLLVSDDDVARTRVNTAGLFLPSTRLNSTVEEGDLLGMVLDPRTSAVVEKIAASRTGRIIALRNQPVVSPGDMVVRLQAMEAV